MAVSATASSPATFTYGASSNKWPVIMSSPTTANPIKIDFPMTESYKTFIDFKLIGYTATGSASSADISVTIINCDYAEMIPHGFGSLSYVSTSEPYRATDPFSTWTAFDVNCPITTLELCTTVPPCPADTKFTHTGGQQITLISTPSSPVLDLNIPNTDA